MSHSSSPFKSYDIRGLVATEITQLFAARLACALVDVEGPGVVALGYDMRESSPSLARAMEEVFFSKGVRILDIGLCTTPVLNSFIATHSEVDLGIMITASHNPASYNGIKLCRKQAIPIGSGSGMEEIARAFSDNEQKYSSFITELQAKPSTAPIATKVEHITTAVEEYLEKVVSELPDRGELLEGLPPHSLKVVADAGNGMAGLTLPRLAKRLPALALTPLYWDLDGTFPNHEANPLQVETLKELCDQVVANDALLGVGFDGDGDRIGVVDEQGQVIPGDVLTALLATELLQTKPGTKILYDLRCSWSVPEAIAAAGGVPEMCRVGHAHIKKQMRESNALFAGELSLHFYFSLFSSTEASEYVLLLLLSLLQRTGKPLSALWKPLKKYFHSGEQNHRIQESVETVFERVKKQFGPIATASSDLDGIRYEFTDPNHSEQDWWFNLRASNTEPLVRLNVEARNPTVMKERLEQVTYGILSNNVTAPSTIERDSIRTTDLSSH